MKTIWKFPLFLDSQEMCSIEMPRDAEILTIYPQNRHYILWALVNPTEPEVIRRNFIIKSTGWEFDDTDLKYISTHQVGGFVWHIFEKV